MNKTFWIILIVLIAFLIVGGGFWYLKKYTNILGTGIFSQPSSQIKTSPTINSSSPLAAKTTVKIFLIAIDDSGKSGKKIGCGDSAVAVNREVKPTQAVLKAAIEELLTVKEQRDRQSGLYNALYLSNLKLASANVDNGKATIKLTGEVLTGGECDIPRIQAQFEETALQFPTVKEVEIFVNDKNLDEILSLKDE